VSTLLTFCDIKRISLEPVKVKIPRQERFQTEKWGNGRKFEAEISWDISKEMKIWKFETGNARAKRISWIFS
jgi:hypothetical protein